MPSESVTYAETSVTYVRPLEDADERAVALMRERDLEHIGMILEDERLIGMYDIDPERLELVVDDTRIAAIETVDGRSALRFCLRSNDADRAMRLSREIAEAFGFAPSGSTYVGTPLNYAL